MATVPCVLGHSRVSNSRRYTLPFSRTRIRKYLVVEEGTIPSEKVPLPMDPHARRATQVDFSKFGRSCTTTWVCTDLAWASGSNGMASSFSSWRIISKAKSDFNSSATVSALISDFLDLSKVSIREEAALATNWIKDRREGLKLQSPLLATITGPSWRSYPENTTADVQHALDKCESLVSWKQLILHGNQSAIVQDFSPHMSVLRRPFLPSMQFECCMILQGTLGGNFDIFAATGESTAWVLLWKTRSRPIGGRGCLVVQFHFFKTAFDPRAWTLVVFWKENFGRPPQLIIPENGGGDNTNYPSPPKISFFGDPEVPL